MSQVDAGFGSAIEASAAGAVRNGDRRCNRLGDPGRPRKNQSRDSEAELGGEDSSQGNDGGPYGTFYGTRGVIGTITPVNCIPTESV